ncbi:adhesion G protein-coupled receptor L3-like [Mercenaria mercenaria]|uniref:adhesion G protein-coupled receptor L3-like n=1 Tax=Mercenaria mercenaria TaxID=6596 RepID=UPI00234EB285|nr:adhesion G protein-coupled receptor L3-like [Mercenaria mercenaria]
MSPFSEADSSSQALRIISIIGISVSIICLLVTCVVHLCLWKRVRNDRTTRLMNLCTALLLSYIIFLAGVDRTESSIACAAIAAVLQYIYLVVFSIMLVEGVEIAVTLLVVFKTKSRTKLLLILAWVIPAMIVGISLGVTKLNGYGTENFCWLSVSNGVIWAFVGPALVIIFFNIICLFIVIRTMFQLTAVKSKKTSEKVRTSLWSLCVLVPITGISWILGIFYVNDSFYFIQYIFAILNGLQGFFIFLFHCLLNKQVKNAYKLHARKKSATYLSTNPTSKDERNTKSKENISSAEDASTRDIRNDWKHEILQESFPQSQVQYGSSLGMFNKGSMRKSAPFSSQSRDQLISDSSMS